jgi:hypothetical protein
METQFGREAAKECGLDHVGVLLDATLRHLGLETLDEDARLVSSQIRDVHDIVDSLLPAFLQHLLHCFLQCRVIGRGVDGKQNSCDIFW